MSFYPYFCPKLHIFMISDKFLGGIVDKLLFTIREWD